MPAKEPLAFAMRSTRWERFVRVGQNQTANAPPLAVPFLFFATGLAGLTVASLLLAAHTAAAVAGARLSPPLLATAHLYALAGVTATMMGASYQLVPVVLDSRLFSPRLAYVHGGLHALGTAVLVLGMALGRPTWMAVGALCLLAALAAFLANQAVTLARARRFGPMGLFLATAWAYLAAAMAIGSWMAWTFARPQPGLARALPVHLLVALAGWVSLTLVGVSYRLWAMFLPARRVTAGHLLGVWGAMQLAIGGGLWFLFGHAPGAWVSGAGFLLALMLLGRDLAAALGHRRRLPDDGALWAILAAWPALAAALASGLAFAVSGQPRWAVVAGYLFFAGWCGASIVGYLQKIVPFLLWLHAFGHRPGRGRGLLLAQIWPPPWARGIAAGYLGGLAVAAAALALGRPALAALGLSEQALSLAALTAAAYRAVARVRRVSGDFRWA